MKAISQELIDLLQDDLTSAFFVVDLFRFDLQGGGAPLLYCSGHQNISANGLTYLAGGVFGSSDSMGGPYFDTTDNKVKLHQKIGLGVDSMVIDILPGNATVLGSPFLSACRNRIFDGALCSIERAFMPTYGDTTRGTVTIFQGAVGSIAIGRSIATFTINSYLERLNIELPRNIWQPGCSNTLGDSMCQVNLATYSVNLVDAGSSTTTQINAIITVPFAGYYDLGRIKFTSGTLIGEQRPIQTLTAGSPGNIILVAPLTGVPTAGDGFTLYPGCNKSFTDVNGCPKFANQARFRGEPAVPNPIAAF